MARPSKKIGDITDAAITLFAQRGFHAVTLKQIAKQADVSQGLVIHHFKTLEGLYEHVLAEVRPHTQKILQPLIEENPEPSDELLKYFLQQYIRHRYAGTDNLKVLDWSRLDGNITRSDSEIEFLKRLSNWFEKAQEKDIIRTDMSPEDIVITIAAVTQYRVYNQDIFDQRTSSIKIANTDNQDKEQAKTADLLYTLISG